MTHEEFSRKGGQVKSPRKSEAAKARNAKRKAEGKPQGGRPKGSKNRKAGGES